MEIIILAAILVLFLLPSILMGRKQRQRQREVAEFQKNLIPGQRVVTAGGIIGTVVSTDNNGIEVEVAPNVVVSFERMGILRSADALGTADEPTVYEESSEQTETNPDNYGSGNYGESDSGFSSEPKN